MDIYECRVCGEELGTDLKSCPTCGTSAEMPTVAASGAQIDSAINLEVEQSPPNDASVLQFSHPIACPECGAAITPDSGDEFCVCGAQVPTRTEQDKVQPTPTPPLNPSFVNPLDAAFTRRPAKGTYFLTLFSKEKLPIAYFPIKGDYTLVGRSDPIRGDFPDADIGQFFDSSDSKKVSRRHLLVIRARDTQNFFVRALAKSTGTQVENALLEELIDHPIVPGTRIVLGGTIRMKFEYEG